MTTTTAAPSAVVAVLTPGQSCSQNASNNDAGQEEGKRDGDVSSAPILMQAAPKSPPLEAVATRSARQFMQLSSDDINVFTSIRFASGDIKKAWLLSEESFFTVARNKRVVRWLTFDIDGPRIGVDEMMEGISPGDANCLNLPLDVFKVSWRSRIGLKHQRGHLRLMPMDYEPVSTSTMQQQQSKHL